MLSNVNLIQAILDLLTVGLGSYGAYTIIKEYVEASQLPLSGQLMQIVKKRWPACLALLVANLLFFYRIFSIFRPS